MAIFLRHESFDFQILPWDEMSHGQTRVLLPGECEEPLLNVLWMTKLDGAT